jgi:hypothetical protein
MGVTARSQILEVYLLHKILSPDNPSDRFHPVFTKDQLATEIEERYGFSWDADFELGLNILYRRYHGPRIIQLSKERSIWVFGKEKKCTAFIHPAFIETLRAFYEEDAKIVYERTHDHSYESALEAHLNERGRRESHVNRGGKEREEIPF